MARQKAGKNPSRASHPYPLREIARQAGLSEATVDRVLNGRGGVRASTAQTVQQAIDELDRQRTQVRLTGRTFLVDVVMQAPARFTAAVRTALEGELPTLRPAVFRARFHLRETAPVAEVVALLDAVRRRGSHGVLLKGPDVPEVAEAGQRLVAAGIPVVTLVTDVPASGRLAYVGIDNRAAGATAAYLIGQWLGDAPGDVLVTLSRSVFRGEEEREMGFRATLRDRALVVVPDTDGLDARPGRRGARRAPRHPCGLLDRRRQRGDARRVRRARVPASSSPTTSTPTTSRSCAPGGSPRCCTTTSGRTCGARATSSCRRTGRCRAASCRGRRASRW